MVYLILFLTNNLSSCTFAHPPNRKISKVPRDEIENTSSIYLVPTGLYQTERIKLLQRYYPYRVEEIAKKIEN